MTKEQRQNHWIAGVCLAMGLLWSLAVWINFIQGLTPKTGKFTFSSFFFIACFFVLGLVWIYSAICFGRRGSLKAFGRVAGWFLFFTGFLLLGVLSAVVSNSWVFNIALPLTFASGLMLYLVVMRRFARSRGFPCPQVSEAISRGAVFVFSLLIWNLCNQIVELCFPPPVSASSSPYYTFVLIIIPIIIANRTYRWTTQAIWKEDSK